MWLLNAISKLSTNLIATTQLNSGTSLTSIRNGCYRASIGRNRRPIYARLYPVTLVKPDGSSIRINYPEPISVIRLPFDVNQLDESERKRRLLKRQMSNKVDTKQLKENKNIFDRNVKFNPKKYLNLDKKQK